MKRPAPVTAAEQDVVSNHRRLHTYLNRAGVTAGIKRGMRRRERRDADRDLRRDAN